MEDKQIHLTFRAVDSFSPIARAEYSIDAGDWQIVEPVGHISDFRSRITTSRWQIPAAAIPRRTTRQTLPAGKRTARAATAAQEHTIIVRVYDRFENVGVRKSW